jgi:hypothetical protein
LGGFPERARILIGCTFEDSVLHVCGGRAKDYPYRGGFGPKDKTMDIDGSVCPDFCGDASKSIPLNAANYWDGLLIDPPYSREDAMKYATGNYPKPAVLLANALGVVKPGGKVGLIHYYSPRSPKKAKFIALVGVTCGFNNRIRAYSVYERLSGTREQDQEA